jgi:two-component system cell cycle sensor histidine kinase/response regulator CckA
MKPIDNKSESSEPLPLPEPRSNPHTVVLLVDDDPMMLRLTELSLKMLGYPVLVAESGEAALAFARLNPAIHVLITDVILPEISGVELAEKLCETHPEVKVIYISGHARPLIESNGMRIKPAHFLQKPFSPAELGASIAAILAEHVPS